MRVGKKCYYAEAPTSVYSLHSVQNPEQCIRQGPRADSSAIPVWASLNLNTASLSRPSLDDIVAQEAFKTLGAVADVQRTSDGFFSSVHEMLPFLSKRKFNARLSTIWLNPSAEFIVLALCMQLIVQLPKDSTENMRSLLYITAKSMITFQESAGRLSIELAQSRLLIAVYELGQGLNPAASISISACAATGYALGVDQKLHAQNFEGSASTIASEEERRLWWSIVIVERYVNLVNKADHFSTKAPGLQALLPMDEDSWEQDETTTVTPLTMSTLSSVEVGSLARLCQIFYLVGRVLTHIFTPSSDSQFNLDEGHQLELTFNAYYDVLLEGLRTSKGKEYCAAFGACSSALMSLYKCQLDQSHGTDDATLTSLSSISDATVHISSLLRGTEGNIEIDSLSLFVPNAFHQAALVQWRLWLDTSNHRYKHGFESMKMILQLHGRRWKIAGVYHAALEELSVDQVI